MTPGTIQSMGFSRQEYWSGLPCPPPGNLPDPGVKPKSLAFPALAGGLFTTAPPEEPMVTLEGGNGSVTPTEGVTMGLGMPCAS